MERRFLQTSNSSIEMTSAPCRKSMSTDDITIDDTILEEDEEA